MRLASFLAPTLLLLPGIALAAPRNFSELANLIVGLLNTATATLIIFGFVVYFWGLAINIPNFGKEKAHEKVKAYFLWGLIVIVVMVSIWGIIRLLQATFRVTSTDPIIPKGIQINTGN